jgi:hypothetical protein
MTSLDEFIAAAIIDFETVAALADADFITESISVEVRPRPHKAPTMLPVGKIAVYAFFLNGQTLKVGKVGRKSVARYTSQHYSPGSAASTLASSIVTNAARVGAIGVDEATVGEWIRRNTDRVNLLMSASFGLPVLSLLEAFLHVRWKPLFEGRSGPE